jgi:GNAT superfamily N-acetyltransferase
MRTKEGGKRMEIKIIERQGIDEAIDEITPLFFSQDRAEVERNFEGHAEGNSSSVIGYQGGEPVGIITIRWECRYPPFKEQNIPLIQNIEIRWDKRGQGIGYELMEHTERYIATRANRAGICVGIFDAYGPAQRLYVKRGYLPDGRGVCRGHVPLTEGETITIDHDLLLWLVKELK